MAGVYSSPYSEIKRWCSCLGKEWDMWYGGVPIKRRPKSKEIAKYKDVNGNYVTLHQLTITPLECHSKNEIVAYRIVADYKELSGSTWAGDVSDYDTAMRIFLDAVDDMLRLLRRR